MVVVFISFLFEVKWIIYSVFTFFLESCFFFVNFLRFVKQEVNVVVFQIKRRSLRNLFSSSTLIFHL